MTPEATAIAIAAAVASAMMPELSPCAISDRPR
jgi:hypothetical protein